MNSSVYIYMNEEGEGHVACAEAISSSMSWVLQNSSSYIRYQWVWQDTTRSNMIQAWQIPFLNPKKCSLNISLARADVLLCHEVFRVFSQHPRSKLLSV